MTRRRNNIPFGGAYDRMVAGEANKKVNETAENIDVFLESHPEPEPEKPKGVATLEVVDEDWR